MPHVIRDDGSEEELVEDINNSGEEPLRRERWRVDKSEPRLLRFFISPFPERVFRATDFFARPPDGD